MAQYVIRFRAGLLSGYVGPNFMPTADINEAERWQSRELAEKTASLYLDNKIDVDIIRI